MGNIYLSGTNILLDEPDDKVLMTFTWNLYRDYMIGSNNQSGLDGFIGKVGNLLVYKKVLTQTEIDYNYTNQNLSFI